MTTMTRPRIPIAGPSITQREIDLVTEAAANAWYANANEYNVRFERDFAAYVGRRHAVALPSCTSAIHLALAAMNISPGDEVIVPDATWIASAAPISYLNATPVFADIDPQTWCITADTIRPLITDRTRAIIGVDLYGGMADWHGIDTLAREHNLRIIEDAAEAMGSAYDDKPAGSFGDAAVFSFHGTKTLTTGEGGMLVTDDDALHERVLVLRDHGRAPGDPFFYFTEIAYKYKMSAMQAAMGIAQLERINELVAKKRETFAWYAARLADHPHLRLNHEPPDTLNTYWMNTIIVDPLVGLDKKVLQARLRDCGIDTRPFFHPLSSLPAYQQTPGVNTARARNKTTYAIAPYGLNLPSALALTEDDVDYVCQTLREIIAEAPAG